jgi:hypothetical protein
VILSENLQALANTGCSRGVLNHLQFVTSTTSPILAKTKAHDKINHDRFRPAQHA